MSSCDIHTRGMNCPLETTTCGGFDFVFQCQCANANNQTCRKLFETGFPLVDCPCPQSPSELYLEPQFITLYIICAGILHCMFVFCLLRYLRRPSIPPTVTATDNNAPGPTTVNTASQAFTPVVDAIPFAQLATMPLYHNNTVLPAVLVDTESSRKLDAEPAWGRV